MSVIIPSLYNPGIANERVAEDLKLLRAEICLLRDDIKFLIANSGKCACKPKYKRPRPSVA